MGSLLSFLILLLSVYFWLIIATVVISWLVVFGVLNMRNANVAKVCGLINRLVDPAVKHIRRFVPAIGGIDISPMILIFGIVILKDILRSMAY